MVGDERTGHDKPELHLLDLSDYSLLHVFSYLNSTSLYQLSKTCKRFEVLVKEKRLWHRIEARDNPLAKEKLDYCIGNLNARTSLLCLAANNRCEQVSTYSFLTSNVSRNLRVLALENQLIRGDLLTLAEYPNTLVELSFRRSFVLNFSHFFRHSDDAMRNLKVLILDECGWVESNMVVPISKYPNLEVLSLYMCKKLSDSDISYLSLAGCFGFKNLRVLDARFTGLGDQILKSFYKHKVLRELYFQSYVGTYPLEKSQRELELVIGRPARRITYSSVYDDVPDTQLEGMRTLFGRHVYKTCRMQTLSDEGVVMYRFVEPDLTQDYRMESVLYEPPYGRCKCGFYDCDRTGRAKQPPHHDAEQLEANKAEIARLEGAIASERGNKYLSHLYMLKPRICLDLRRAQVNVDDYAAEATPENKSMRWLNLREPRNEYEIAMLEHTDLHSFTPRLSGDNIVLDFGGAGSRARFGQDDDLSDEEEYFINPVLLDIMEDLMNNDPRRNAANRGEEAANNENGGNDVANVGGERDWTTSSDEDTSSDIDEDTCNDEDVTLRIGDSSEFVSGGNEDDVNLVDLPTEEGNAQVGTNCVNGDDAERDVQEEYILGPALSLAATPDGRRLNGVDAENEINGDHGQLDEVPGCSSDSRVRNGIVRNMAAGQQNGAQPKTPVDLEIEKMKRQHELMARGSRGFNPNETMAGTCRKYKRDRRAKLTNTIHRYYARNRAAMAEAERNCSKRGRLEGAPPSPTLLSLTGGASPLRSEVNASGVGDDSVRAQDSPGDVEDGEESDEFYDCLGAPDEKGENLRRVSDVFVNPRGFLNADDPTLGKACNGINADLDVIESVHPEASVTVTNGPSSSGNSLFKTESGTSVGSSSKRKNVGACSDSTSKKAKRGQKGSEDAEGELGSANVFDDVRPGPSGLSVSNSSSADSVPAVSHEAGPDGVRSGPFGDLSSSSGASVTTARSSDSDDRSPWRRDSDDADEDVVFDADRILIGGNGEMKTTSVKKLSLRGYGKVTDTSLHYLSRLKLELLDVTQTSVTKRGVSDFMVRNPDCRVIHESACVCRPRLHF